MIHPRALAGAYGAPFPPSLQEGSKMKHRLGSVRDFHSMDITEPHLSLKSQRWRAGWEDTWREKGCVYVWKGCDAVVVKVVVCVYVRVHGHA